jgi:hypothetical protein
MGQLLSSPSVPSEQATLPTAVWEVADPGCILQTQPFPPLPRTIDIMGRNSQQESILKGSGHCSETLLSNLRSRLVFAEARIGVCCAKCQVAEVGQGYGLSLG